VPSFLLFSKNGETHLVRRGFAPAESLGHRHHSGWTKAHPYKNLLRRMFVPYGGGLLPPLNLFGHFIMSAGEVILALAVSNLLW